MKIKLLFGWSIRKKSLRDATLRQNLLSYKVLREENSSNLRGECLITLKWRQSDVFNATAKIHTREPCQCILMRRELMITRFHLSTGFNSTFSRLGVSASDCFGFGYMTRNIIKSFFLWRLEPELKMRWILTAVAMQWNACDMYFDMSKKNYSVRLGHWSRRCTQEGKGCQMFSNQKATNQKQIFTIYW